MPLLASSELRIENAHRFSWKKIMRAAVGLMHRRSSGPALTDASRDRYNYYQLVKRSERMYRVEQNMRRQSSDQTE